MGSLKRSQLGGVPDALISLSPSLVNFSVHFMLISLPVARLFIRLHTIPCGHKMGLFRLPAMNKLIFTQQRVNSKCLFIS